MLVIPDLQVPYHDRRSLNAVHQMMKDHRWDEIVCLGDFMDFDCISSHNKNNLRAVEGKRMDADYEEGQEILALWRKLCPEAKITIIEGNHEYRVNRYIDANPAMEGMIEVPVGLNFKKYRINWVPYWSTGQTYDIGKATFVHGRATNDGHAKKMAYMYGRNVFYGHTHDIQTFSVQTAGNDNTYVGQSLGCLCDYKQSYMRGGPSKWQQGVTVFHFFEDGYFTYNIIRLFKNRFYHEGVTYQG